MEQIVRAERPTGGGHQTRNVGGAGVDAEIVVAVKATHDPLQAVLAARGEANFLRELVRAVGFVGGHRPDPAGCDIEGWDPQGVLRRLAAILSLCAGARPIGGRGGEREIGEAVGDGEAIDREPIGIGLCDVEGLIVRQRSGSLS